MSNKHLEKFFQELDSYTAFYAAAYPEPMLSEYPTEKPGDRGYRDLFAAWTECDEPFFRFNFPSPPAWAD